MRKKEIAIVLIVFSVIAYIFTLSLFTIYANAVLGVSLRVDASPPEVYILSPLNQTYESPVLFTYLVTDASLDSIWYVLLGDAVNQTATINTSQIFSLAPGPYHLILYANDTFGRMNSTEVNFSVNESAPPGPGPAPGSGGGGGGGSGSAGQSPQPFSPQIQNSSNITEEKKFLNIRLTILNNHLLLQIEIASSSTNPLAIDYEVAGENLNYKETEVTGFKEIIEKKLDLNTNNLNTGNYSISIRVKQDNLSAYDRAPFRVEREFPLEMPRKSWLPWLILIIIALLFVIILLLIEQRRIKKRNEGLIKNIKEKGKERKPSLIFQNPLGKKEYVRAIKKPLRKR